MFEPSSTIALPLPLFRRLQELASRHERPIEDIVQQAIELHFDETAAAARSRLVDRLARLEAGLGDPATLQEQVAAETRCFPRVAADAPLDGPIRFQTQTQTQTLPTD